MIDNRSGKHEKEERAKKCCRRSQSPEGRKKQTDDFMVFWFDNESRLRWQHFQRKNEKYIAKG